MSLHDSAAPSRGGFSAPAFAAAATILSALNDRRGFEKIGKAVVSLIETRTDCTLNPKPFDFEPQIREALSLIFEAQSESLLSLKIEASKNPPAPPERERNERKEPISFPNTAQNGGGMKGDSTSFKAQSGPSEAEWEAYCLSIGWNDKAQFEASYRSQTTRHGWESVKSWKGLCGCFFRNATAKAEKAKRFNGAFSSNGGEA